MYKHINKKFRINTQIRLPKVRLIDANGDQLGEVSIEQALEKAQAQGLDLVEVSPKAKPPVCKIMDYGHLLYQNSKQKQTAKKKQHTGEVKGIRLSYNMGKHDIEMRVKQTEKFLQKGYKVKIEMILRGRQKAHPEHVTEVFEAFLDLLNIEHTTEQPLKRLGHKMMVVLTPSKK